MSCAVIGLTAASLVSVIAIARIEINRLQQSNSQGAVRAGSQLIDKRAQAFGDQLLLAAANPAVKSSLMTGSRHGVANVTRSLKRQLRASMVVITDPASLSKSGSVADIVVRGERMMIRASAPVLLGGGRRGAIVAYSPLDDLVAEGITRGLVGGEIAFVSNGEVLSASTKLPLRIPVSRTPQLVKIGQERFSVVYTPLDAANRGAKSSSVGFALLTPDKAPIALLEVLGLRRTDAALAAALIALLILAFTVNKWLCRSITEPMRNVMQSARALRSATSGGRKFPAREDDISILQSVLDDMLKAFRFNEKRVATLTDLDPLTGLYNRRRFQERLIHEVRMCATKGQTLSLLILDLDQFQTYNRDHGQQLGDQALQQLGEILAQSLPDIAIAGRFAGDTFAVALPRCDINGAEAISDRLRHAVQELWNTDPQPAIRSKPAQDTRGHTEPNAAAALTFSAGCAQLGERAMEPEALVLAAEMALAQAKQLGGNRTCRLDRLPSPNEQAEQDQLQQFIEDSSLETIQALAAAVDAKDRYTMGHSQRVADYAKRVAAYIGLSPAEQELIYITATLHDVGKIGVPDAILKKPGRLDPEERAIMDTHPVMGELIVRKAALLHPTLPGVRNHHERWDGLGYPDNLAGEDIPLMARVLAIADTFDAMTSDRPYRKGLDVGTALAEIMKGSGTQFEPRLAVGFVSMMGMKQEPQQLAA